ncbi:restriction endonuclease, partial [Pontibacterium sp.]|uniref:restriction endonuclease n=1 Tax=Pontibacterium sp. TaxID=2036026 RepID=UPI003564035C
IESCREVTPELVDRLKKDSGNLDRIEPLLFEKVVAELMAGNGFEKVKHVGQVKHTSADIFASYGGGEFNEMRFFVEVKKEKGRICVNVFDQIIGAWTSERLLSGPGAGCIGAMIVSLSGFTKFQKYTPEDVHKLGVRLKDRDDLVRWLDGYVEHTNGLWLPNHSLLQ